MALISLPRPDGGELGEEGERGARAGVSTERGGAGVSAPGQIAAEGWVAGTPTNYTDVNLRRRPP